VINVCLVVVRHVLRLNILVTLATDVILLLIMFLAYSTQASMSAPHLVWDISCEKQVGYPCWSLAMVFSVLAAVSGQFHVPVPSTYHDIISQVLIGLHCFNEEH